MRNYYIFWGAFAAALAVVLGAMGAHGVKANFGPYSADIFSTAAEYQMYHALGIIAIGLLAEKKKHLNFVVPVVLFGLGMLCFSGSLYILAIRQALDTDVSFLGPVTPIGGVFFIIGWIWFAVQALKR